MSLTTLNAGLITVGGNKCPVQHQLRFLNCKRKTTAITNLAGHSLYASTYVIVLNDHKHNNHFATCQCLRPFVQNTTKTKHHHKWTTHVWAAFDLEQYTILPSRGCVGLKMSVIGCPVQNRHCRTIVSSWSGKKRRLIYKGGITCVWKMFQLSTALTVWSCSLLEVLLCLFPCRVQFFTVSCVLIWAFKVPSLISLVLVCCSFGLLVLSVSECYVFTSWCFSSCANRWVLVYVFVGGLYLRRFSPCQAVVLVIVCIYLFVFPPGVCFYSFAHCIKDDAFYVLCRSLHLVSWATLY